VVVELERQVMSENALSNMVANSLASTKVEVAIYDFLLPFFLFGHWLAKCHGL
jgi:hypothetical protein